MKYMYYVKPEVPKKNWVYSVGAVIAESKEDAIQKGNESFGLGCVVVEGPFTLSQSWQR